MVRMPFGLDTKLIHAGEPEPRIEGAVGMPIFQSSTYEYAGATSYHDLKYIRLNNTPNHRVLHAKLAALENAEAALVMASGMAAISTTLLTVLRAGDHLLAQNCLYGGTHDFVTRDFPALGLTVDFVDGDRPETWGAKLRPETKAIYVETMSNPLLEVADLEAAATLRPRARARLDHRQHVRQPGQLPPAGARLRSLPSQLHQIHERTRRHRRRRADRAPRAGGSRQPQARAPRRRARSTRRVPASPRHEDARRPRAPAERERARHRSIPRGPPRGRAGALSRARKPPSARARAAPVRRLRRHARVRAPRRRRGGGPRARAGRAADLGAEPRRRRKPHHPTRRPRPIPAWRPKTDAASASRTGSSGFRSASSRRSI